MKTPLTTRTKVLQWLAGVSATAVFAITSQAQTNFVEDFESSTAGSPPSGWSNVAGSATTSGTNSIVPTGGTKSGQTVSSGDRMSRNLTPSSVSSIHAVAYFYDGGQARGLANFWNWANGTYGSGALVQVLGVGKNNAITPTITDTSATPVDTYDGTKYQGRIGVPVMDSTGQNGTASGYFNLNASGAPNRSTGWHKFEVRAGGMDDGTAIYNYYVDGKLGRSLTNKTANTPGTMPAINSLSFGYGAGTTTENSFYDGILLVDNAPWVSTQPQDTTVTQGQPLTLTANAVGLATLSYKWQKNGANISGANGLTYNIPSTSTGDAGNYTFIVSNSLDVVTSRVAVVTIIPLIQITQQPVGNRVNVGENYQFNVGATGAGTLFYQWKKNGTNLVGKTDSTLNINSAQISDRGSYTVVVTNSVGDPATTSSPAVLQVNTAPVLLISNQVVTVGSMFSVTTPYSDDYSTNGVPFENFDSYSNGQTKMFDAPRFAGSTAGSIDLGASDINRTNYSRVTNSFPGIHGSTNVLALQWSWATGSDPNTNWLRLTTSGFNPIIPTNPPLRFDIYTDRELKYGWGIRESNPTGAIGASGGTSGALEFVGIGQIAPPKVVYTLSAGSWQTITLDLNQEQNNSTIGSFSGGNGKIDSTTGKVVLESLLFNASDSDPDPISGNYHVYLDNFVVVPTDPITFSLDTAPAGATIDPVTGAIAFNPPGLGTYNFTVRASDTGSFVSPGNPLSSTKSFTVTVVQASTKLNYTFSNPNLTLTWSGSFTLQSAPALTGPWTDVTPTSGYSTTINSAMKFYRLRN